MLGEGDGWAALTPTVPEHDTEAARTGHKWVRAQIEMKPWDTHPQEAVGETKRHCHS